MSAHNANHELVADHSNPGEVSRMPERPYLVLHAGLPFYADPRCEKQVHGASLVVLRCEDPRQTHHPVECMPTSKSYEKGQVVCWELNYKRMWESAWYWNPETAGIEKAWSQAVEFIGMVVRLPDGPTGGGH